MNVPPSEAKRLTLWEYEAMLVNWNAAHEVDPQPDPATIDEVRATEEFFAAHPELLN